MSAVPSVERATPEQDLPERIPAEMTISEAVQLAVRYHQRGYLDGAEAIYRRVLEHAPELPDAVHYLGVLTHQRGRSEEAVALLRRAAELDPNRAGFHNNLGNVLNETGHFEAAAQAYRRSLELVPDDADVHNNLGTVHRWLGQMEEAGRAYGRAIELNPRHADAHFNMGNLLTAVGKVKEAVRFFCTSITLRPVNPESRRLLGLAYANLGRMDEARQVYRQWLDEEPGDPVAVHMLAACGGEAIPARASDGFVELVFDSFARSFDVKLERLKYRAPQLVADEVSRSCGNPTKSLRILDAGCGTGLCGPLVASFAAKLIGVDLSSEMLARARPRDVYDELHRGELVAFMLAHAGEYDLVISADTLCYFGALEGAIRAANVALAQGGVLIFTVEEGGDSPDGAGYHLNAHGRYSHSPAYVAAALQGAGFEIVGQRTVVLRMESGSPVAGLLVSARRLAAW